MVLPKPKLTKFRNALSAKLTIGFAGLVLAISLLAVYPWWVGIQQQKSYSTLKQKNLQVLLSINKLWALATEASDLLVIGAQTQNWEAYQKTFNAVQDRINTELDYMLEANQFETNMVATSLSLQIVNKVRKVQATQNEVALLLSQNRTVDLALTLSQLQSSLSEIKYFVRYLEDEERRHIANWEAEMAESQMKIVHAFIIIFVLAVIGFLFLHTAIVSQIHRPLKSLQRPLRQIAEGNPVQTLPKVKQRELLPLYGYIKQLNNALAEFKLFLRGIMDKQGEQHKLNLDQAFKEGSELGNSMRELVGFLAEKVETDRKRAWHSEGIGLFADLLRSEQQDIKKLCDVLLSELVNHLGVEQGAIYLLNEQENLEMVSCYAFGYQKNRTAEIEKHEGLIGEAFFEQRTMIVDEIPEDYFKISTGLGQLKPKTLMIVPLMLNGRAVGMLEIASRKQIESYQKEFVEKIGENIAATITNIQGTLRTQTLLEKTKQQTEELQAQEEEMRQNMEELQATQEELHRQKEEGMAFIHAVNHGLLGIETDTRGHILQLNQRAVDTLGYSMAEGKIHDFHYLLIPSEKEKIDFEVLSEYLLHHHFCEINISLRGKDGTIWKSRTNFIPIKNSDGEIVRIHCISTLTDWEEGTDTPLTNFKGGATTFPTASP